MPAAGRGPIPIMILLLSEIEKIVNEKIRFVRFTRSG
jgi:hypothetical protein